MHLSSRLLFVLHTYLTHVWSVYLCQVSALEVGIAVLVCVDNEYQQKQKRCIVAHFQNHGLQFVIQSHFAPARLGFLLWQRAARTGEDVCDRTARNQSTLTFYLATSVGSFMTIGDIKYLKKIFLASTFVLNKVHRMTITRYGLLQSQRYPIYIVTVALSSKVQSISL